MDPARRKGPTLGVGATLGLFSPGSAADPVRFQAGREWLESVGYRAKLGASAPNDSAPAFGSRLHAAPPEVRARDFAALWRDPTVDGLVCVRGGSGTLGLLPHLDFADLASTPPKLLVGMSDVTALSLALHARLGLAGIVAATVVQLSRRMSAYTSDRWLALVRGPFASGEMPLPKGTSLEVLYDGEAEGTLLPANLSLLTSLIGTPYLPPLDGAILVLEDIRETPPSLDRMVSQLALSGVADRVAGIVLAQFTDCRSREAHVSEEDGRSVVRAWARSMRVPVLEGFPHGHDRVSAALPLGTRARIGTSPPRLELLEAPTRPTSAMGAV